MPWVPLHTSLPQSPSGSVPCVWGVQVPSLPLMLQASQASAQFELQQKPSTHLPLKQLLGPSQEAPLSFFDTQEPLALLLQYVSGGHTLSDAHGAQYDKPGP